MTKQEIQALIDAKIAGQGSAVDVGGALPTILHEILEMAAGGENVQSNWDETNTESPQYIQNKPSIPAPYSLPTASAEVLGGVKVGSGLSIKDGVLSARVLKLACAVDGPSIFVTEDVAAQIAQNIGLRPIVLDDDYGSVFTVLERDLGGDITVCMFGSLTKVTVIPNLE